MVLQRVSLVTIGCFDLPLLRKFYNNLGWEETDHGYVDYAVFKTAGVLLSLYSVEKLVQGTGLQIQNANTFFKGVIFAINVDKPSQVGETIKEVRSIGGKILSDLRLLLTLKIIYGKLPITQILHLMKEALCLPYSQK